MVIPAQLISIGFAGFALCGGLGSLCFVWARRRWQMMGLFALASFTQCGYVIYIYALQASPTPEAAYLPIRIKEGFGNLFLLILPFLYRAICGQRPGRSEVLTTGFFVTIIGLALIRPYGFEWNHINRMAYSSVGGIYFVQGEPSRLVILIRVGQLLLSIHCMRIAWRGWRNRHNGLWTVIALPAALLSAVIYSLGGIMGLWRMTFDSGECASIMLYLCLGASVFQTERAIVTEHERLFASLLEREEKLSALTNAGLSLSCLLDLEGRIVFANKAALQLVGVSAPQILGTHFPSSPWWSHSPELQARVRAAMTAILEGTTVRFETWHPSGAGHEITLDFSLSPYYGANGRLSYLIAEGRDITERKQNEQNLHESLQRLHILASHLQSVREEERVRVAREVHDELGQALTGLKFELAWLRRHTAQSRRITPLKALLDKMDSMNDQIETSIGAVRRIATELRPAILDAFGLAPALEWLAQDFQQRSGLQITFISPQESILLDSEQATAVFRIAQESLTNVLRHARATRVEISLEIRAEQLVLTVADDGTGISPTSLKSGRSFGLLGMQERALLLGGELEIKGRPQQGTSITLYVPFPRGQELPDCPICEPPSPL
jgi:PAS domain S-box-containing protein